MHADHLSGVMMKRVPRQICLALVLAVYGAAAWAQASWPTRPVRLVVPFPAGGGVDIMSRYLAEMLGTALGQSFVVENRPGAATLIATEAVANARPDGYTLLVATTSSLVSNRFQYKKLRYDPDGFELVSLISYYPMVLLANPSLPVRNLTELIEYARKHPDALSFGSFGTGTYSHLAVELLDLRSGVKMTHVPYKGAAEALPALIGNQIQIYADAISSSLSYVKAGTLKALAVTSPTRTATLPDVPTVAEQGFPGFDMSSWASIVAPRDTPKEITYRLQAALSKILQSREYKERLFVLGQELPPSKIGPGPFVDQIKSDIPKIRDVMKEAGVQPI